MSTKPSNAFVGASWTALGVGAFGYLIGLWHAQMQLNEKGYYFTVLMFGLFAVVSVQKSVRDRLEGIPVTDLYYGISWFATILSIVLLTIGLWNATLLPSEKGFYAFAFLLAIFGAVAVQKNTRDKLQAEKEEEKKDYNFNNKLPLLWLIVSMALAVPASAQNDIGQKVDKVINKAMKEEGIPGVAVAVIRDGNILFEKGYGIRSVNGAAKVDEQTVFSIGSVSKAFTAVGLMLLVQENKLVLDDPIKKYMKGLPDSWQNITIRQFMAHTSGIPELKGDKDNGSFEQTIAQAGKMKMSFRPGARQQYNNFNFAVMGKLIETMTGMDYLTFMQKRVFGPDGMVSTGVKPSSNDVSTGHLEKNGKLKSVETHFSAGDFGVPSGGLQTTLADFVKLSQALYKGQLLRKKTLDVMWTPYSAALSNTPGWHSRVAANELVIHKGGGGTGIGSVCDYKIVPSRNLYVIVMFNKARNKISPSDVTDDVLLQCFNIPKRTKGEDGGEGNER